MPYRRQIFRRAAALSLTKDFLDIVNMPNGGPFSADLRRQKARGIAFIDHMDTCIHTRSAPAVFP